MKCEFCSNEFTSKTSLTHHQKTAKYCIVLQGIDKDTNFVCLNCGKKLSTQNRLYTHEQTCKKHMEDIISLTTKILRNLENYYINVFPMIFVCLHF